MFLEEVFGLLTELCELGAFVGAAGTGEFNSDAGPKFVGELRVHDALLRAFDQRHKEPEVLPDLFEHRVSDINPPLIVLDVLDQFELLSDYRDGLLLFECSGNLHHDLALTFEWFPSDNCEFRPEHDDIEAFGVLMFGFEFGGEFGDPITERCQVANGDALPCIGGAESFDKFQVRSHEEVAVVH